ncbi:MAG: ThiF family adenylyltransferase [Blastocatellia bacterium]|nr:ThiF family adenylyltransferase [Blastocatellia bacterium]
MKETLHIQSIEREDRFDRLRRIAWWDQEKLKEAKILVIGAGALGNEILKNLALLGVGNIFVADLDLIEDSNLSRSVLYRQNDRGRRKAEVAAEAVREIYPDVNIHWFHGDVVYELGLGVYNWADIVIAGVDNREARLHINRSCWKTGTPWVDGATEILQGVVRVFIPPAGPCYECTMTKKDWEVLNERRGCGGLRAEEMRLGRVPTTPITSSIIAAIECQEAIKFLHGLDVLAGRGMVFNGLSCDSYIIDYNSDEECNSHETYDGIVELDLSVKEATARDLLSTVCAHLGEGSVLEFNHDILISFYCPACKEFEAVFKPLGQIPERAARCSVCGQNREINSAASASDGDEFLDRTLADSGIPPYDILAGRKGLSKVAFQFSGDARSVLGSLYKASGQEKGVIA